MTPVPTVHRSDSKRTLLVHAVMPKIAYNKLTGVWILCIKQTGHWKEISRISVTSDASTGAKAVFWFSCRLCKKKWSLESKSAHSPQIFIDFHISCVNYFVPTWVECIQVQHKCKCVILCSILVETDVDSTTQPVRIKLKETSSVDTHVVESTSNKLHPILFWSVGQKNNGLT